MPPASRARINMFAILFSTLSMIKIFDKNDLYVNILTASFVIEEKSNAHHGEWINCAICSAMKRNKIRMHSTPQTIMLKEVLLIPENRLRDSVYEKFQSRPNQRMGGWGRGAALRPRDSFRPQLMAPLTERPSTSHSLPLGLSFPHMNFHEGGLGGRKFPSSLTSQGPVIPS